MAVFECTNVSDSDVPAAREDIWSIITAPERLARLTPIIERISADGDLWTWHLKAVSALGARVTPSFTERMVFEDGKRLTYTHVPPRGVRERAGAEGTYELADLPGGGTHLSIELTLQVELPLPKVSARAVEAVMAATMARTGQRFAENLYAELGIPGTPQLRQRDGGGRPITA